MGSTIKLFYGDLPPTSSIRAYEAPSNKYAVVRSIIITNRTSAVTQYYLHVGSTNLGNTHVLQPYQVLILDDVNIPVLPGQGITVRADTASSVAMWISGEEIDYDISNFPYVSGYGSMQTSVGPLVNLDASHDWMIKSLILSNTNTGSSRTVTINFTTSSRVINVIPSQVIKPRDILVIPLPNIVLPKGTSVTGFVTGASDVWFGITCMKVGD